MNSEVTVGDLVERQEEQRGVAHHRKKNVGWMVHPVLPESTLQTKLYTERYPYICSRGWPFLTAMGRENLGPMEV